MYGEADTQPHPGPMDDRLQDFQRSDVIGRQCIGKELLLEGQNGIGAYQAAAQILRD